MSSDCPIGLVSQNARSTDDRLEQDFREHANDIPNMDLGPDMAHRGFITPDTPHVPYSNELNEKYGQAKTCLASVTSTASCCTTKSSV